MIQRIQTVYFLLTAILAVIVSCLPLGRWVNHEGDTVASMGAFRITHGEEAHLAPFGIILILVAVIMVVCILIYHHRIYQARLSILAILLLFGGYAVYAVYAMAMTPEDMTFHPEWGAALPIVGVYMQWLAWKAVMKDEMMVRSLDRLR